MKLGVLCDTGFLIRLNQPQDELHANARASLKNLLAESRRPGQIQQESYYGSGMTVEILRSEIDASGYDLVLECNGAGVRRLRV